MRHSRWTLLLSLTCVCILLLSLGSTLGYLWANIHNSTVSGNRHEKQIAVYSDSSTQLGTVTIALTDTGFGIAVRPPGAAPPHIFFFDVNGFDGFMIGGIPFDHPRGRIEVTVRDIDGDGIVGNLDMDPEWTDAFKNRDISEDIMEVVREQIRKY